MNTLPTLPPTYGTSSGDAPSGNAPSPSARTLLLVSAVVSLVLRYIPGAQYVTYPLNLFVTYIHEGGHALMTYLTGGGVDYIQIYPNGSGVTLSRGGIPFLFFPAGYIGATLFGGLCLLLTRRTRGGRFALWLMTGAILLVTMLCVPALAQGGAYGLAFGLLLASVLGILAVRLPERAAAFTAAFLAVQCCLNAVGDIRNLLFLTANTHLDNDAVFMARTYFGSPWLWALLWAGCALCVLFVTLRAYLRPSVSSAVPEAY